MSIFLTVMHGATIIIICSIVLGEGIYGQSVCLSQAQEISSRTLNSLIPMSISSPMILHLPASILVILNMKTLMEPGSILEQIISISLKK